MVNPVDQEKRSWTCFRRGIAALAVVAAAVGVGMAGAPTSSAQSGCAQPYSPLWQELMSGPEFWPPWPSYPFDPPFYASGVDTPGGPRLVAPHPEVADLVVDTDGDGIVDEVSEESGSEPTDHVVVIERSDGTIRLHVDLVEFDRANRAIRPVGDLDGDGRVEVLVGLRVLPGTIEPGDHDLAAVSIAMPSGAVVAAGDQDRDGTFDLVVGTVADPTGTAYLVAGPAVLAPGPGGALVDLGPTSFPGRPVVAFDVGGGPPAVGVVSFDELTVLHGSEVVRYEVRRGLGNDIDVSVLTFEGRRYLTLQTSTAAAGAFRSAISFWDLDDPCRRLPSTAPTPPPTTGRADCLCAPPVPGRQPAPPAVPVRTSPGYAG